MFASEKSNSEQHFGSWMWRPDNWSEYVMTSFLVGCAAHSRMQKERGSSSERGFVP